MILVKMLQSVQLPGPYAVAGAGAVAGVYNAGEICGLPTVIARLLIADGTAAGLGRPTPPSSPAPQDQQQFWNNN